MSIKFANNASSKLAASLETSDVTLSVLPGDGAKFPSLTPGDYFMATIVNSTGLLEIVKVTARTGDVFTIERAQEGTVARDFNAGAGIQNRFTAGSFDPLLQEMQQELDDKMDEVDQKLVEIEQEVDAKIQEIDDALTNNRAQMQAIALSF